MPTNQSVRRMRLAALLLFANCLLAPVAAGLLIYALCTYDIGLVRIGLGLLLLAGLVVLLQWLIASTAKCPLCMGPVLADKNCIKHRSARALLGSYRLRVALSLILTGRFRCQYCGEPTQLVVRYPRSR